MMMRIKLDSNYRRSSTSFFTTLSILLCILLVQKPLPANSITTGKPHSTVQTLTSSNFKEAINDPANGIWLLKFYAPWCGHCKKLAPLLDQIATYFHEKGPKVAIGKIDCTIETKLCRGGGGDNTKEGQQGGGGGEYNFDIKSYPTLKIYKDGEFFPFIGKRDADSIITLMENIATSKAIHETLIERVNDLYELMDTTSSKWHQTKVGFVIYDPRAKGNDLDQILSSTKLMQIFNQVARKMQVETNFAVLNPNISDKELKPFNIMDKKKSIIIRVEKDVDPIFYEGDWSSPDFLDFVKDKNLPLVVELEASNFRAITSRGKPLVIGVLSKDWKNADLQDVQLMSQLKDYVKSASANVMDNYLFTFMDGKKWFSFLSQFGISQNALPQVFVLDVQNKIYFQNSTLGSGFSSSSLSSTTTKDNAIIANFMDALLQGKIPEQQQIDPMNQNIFKKFTNFFMMYMPYTLMFVVSLIIMIVYVAMADEDEVDLAAARAQRQEEAKILGNTVKPPVKKTRTLKEE